MFGYSARGKSRGILPNHGNDLFGEISKKIFIVGFVKS